MDQRDREQLAERLRRVQLQRFDGVASKAYARAEVNSATWTRLVQAESVKPHTVTRVVKRFWPATGGDWRLIDQVDEGRGPFDADPAVEFLTDEDRNEVNAMIRELAERRGASTGRAARARQDEAGEAPDSEGPEEGA